jgi:hypothetical protein
MTERPPARCTNCGRVRAAGDLDAARLCEECRAAVLRRATVWSVLAGLAAAIIVATLVGLFVHPTQFVIGWVALVIIAYWIVAKFVRRVAFDAFRARGVPPPEE